MKTLKNYAVVALLTFVVVFQSCAEKKAEKWTLTGTTKIDKVESVYLYSIDLNRQKTLIDSTKRVDDSFTFSRLNTTAAHDRFYFDFDKSQKGGLEFFIANGEHLNLDFNENLEIKISGTSTSDDLNSYNGFKRKEIENLIGFTKIYGDPKLTEEELAEKVKSFGEGMKTLENDKITFISNVKSPELNSYFALNEIQTSSIIEKELFKKYQDALNEEGAKTEMGQKVIEYNTLFDAYKLSSDAGFVDYETLKTGYDKLDPTNKNSVYAKQVEESLVKLEQLGIGKLAPTLKANTLKGKAFDLKSVTNKIVLVDFWASWCGPCRLENPHYKEIYETLKGQDFTIVSYSLDTDQTKWKKAVEKDELTWINISNLKKQKDDNYLKTFQVGAIPANIILVDGKIAARNLFGPQLDDFIQSHL